MPDCPDHIPDVDEISGLSAITPNHQGQPSIEKRRVKGLDGRTTRSPGYKPSQRIRKQIEKRFGWMKVVGGLRRTIHRGSDKVAAWVRSSLPPAISFSWAAWLSPRRAVLEAAVAAGSPTACPIDFGRHTEYSTRVHPTPRGDRGGKNSANNN
jgi:hypothetical protein